MTSRSLRYDKPNVEVIVKGFGVRHLFRHLFTYSAHPRLPVFARVEALTNQTIDVNLSAIRSAISVVYFLVQS